MDAERIAEIAKALSHPARVRIVDLLARQRECRGAEVFSELELAQSTVSEHLRILREAGLVQSTPSGVSTLLCLRQAVLEEFSAAVGAYAGLMTGADVSACDYTCAQTEECS